MATIRVPVSAQRPIYVPLLRAPPPAARPRVGRPGLLLDLLDGRASGPCLCSVLCLEDCGRRHEHGWIDHEEAQAA